jgi:hypothetical protein
VCTLLLGFPWRRLEPWREKCGDRFPSMRPGGYLETSEGSWNSWSHNALRLLVGLCWSPGRVVVQPEGPGAEKGAHYLGLCRLMGNERL